MPLLLAISQIFASLFFLTGFLLSLFFSLIFLNSVALCSGTLWKRKCEACFCPEKSPRFKNRNIWKDSEYSEIAADGRIRHGDGWGLLGRGKGVCRVCKVSWNYFCNLLSENQLLYGKRLFANCHTKLLLKRV